MPTDDYIRNQFRILLEEGNEVLRACGWNGRGYSNGFPNGEQYHRFRARAMNLVRRVCGADSDHYKAMSLLAGRLRTSEFNSYVGLLDAARQDYEGGMSSVNCFFPPTTIRIPHSGFTVSSADGAKRSPLNLPRVVDQSCGGASSPVCRAFSSR